MLELKSYLKEKSKRFLGYPCNARLDYSNLAEFLNFPINNIGDPFKGSSYLVNTHSKEREVLDFFARLLKIDNYLGNVTNGGTEGNLQGLYLARENLENPVLVHSADAHYSVEKAAKILRLPALKIKSQPTGEIDYRDLRTQLSEQEPESVIMCANIGTTMKGAIDSIPKLEQILEGFDYWIHCDAAFFGIYLPFFSDFGFDEHILSVSVSGHKFLGSPIPCGILIGQKDPFKQISFDIEYIGTTDFAIAGSRNGITPLILWLSTRDPQRIKRDASRCLELANYAQIKLNKIGLNAWRNQLSPIVVFDRPDDDLCHRWQLAKKGELAHIIITPGVTKELIDEFIMEAKA